MTTPVRLQLSRRRGMNLQQLSRDTNGLDVVNVARPGKWGNPITKQDCEDAFSAMGKKLPRDWQRLAVKYYDAWLGGELPEFGEPPTVEEIQAELRGKNLACWCPHGSPCHAIVLLKIANA